MAVVWGSNHGADIDFLVDEMVRGPTSQQANGIDRLTGIDRFRFLSRIDRSSDQYRSASVNFSGDTLASGQSNAKLFDCLTTN